MPEGQAAHGHHEPQPPSSLNVGTGADSCSGTRIDADFHAGTDADSDSHSGTDPDPHPDADSHADA
jgi:hypothetical protein